MSELWGINSQLWEEMPELQDKLAIARTKVRAEIIIRNYLWSFFIPWWKKQNCNSEFWGKISELWQTQNSEGERSELRDITSEFWEKEFEKFRNFENWNSNNQNSEFTILTFLHPILEKGRIARKKVWIIRQKGTKTYLETLKTTYLSKITSVIFIYKSLAIISSI